MKRGPAKTTQAEPPSVDGRVPPHDLDAEAAVISAVMIDSRELDKVADVLKPEHFYSEAHRRIYEAFLALTEVGKPTDIISVGSELKNRDRIAQIGGMAYLTELLNAAPLAKDLSNYGRTIREKWRVRQIIATCQRKAAEGYLDHGDSTEFIDGVEQAVYEIARTEEATNTVKLVDAVKENFQKISAAMKRGQKITGIPTGFDAYDAMTAGLHDGDLTIVAARPGMGKTSFVLDIANRVAERPVSSGESIGVVVFSLEMPRDQIANRMVCSDGRVDVGHVRQGSLSQMEWNRLTEASRKLGSIPVWIDDTPAITVLQLRARVRRLQAEFDRTDSEGRKFKRIGVVAVDYLQLMKGRDGCSSREQEISEISRELKGLAKELKVSVIALSQLNRAVESRSDKHPQLSDLRESGAIEQDADNICFIYRDDYYDDETEEKNVAELIIAKQRNGPTGTVKVRFDKQYTRFDNLASDYEMEAAE